MAVHVFRGGMGDDVAAPLERTAVDWCGEGVIDDEGYAMLMGHLGEALYVKDAAAGVGDGLAEKTLGIRTEGRLNTLIIPVGIYEGALYAEFLHRYAKEIVGTSINIIRGDEMITCLTDIEDSIEVGGLSRGSQQTAHAPFKSIDFCGYSIVCGICQTSVEVAGIFEVEEASHLFAGVVPESGTLINWKLLRLAFRGMPAAMNAEGFKILFHIYWS